MGGLKGNFDIKKSIPLIQLERVWREELKLGSEFSLWEVKWHSGGVN